MDQQLQPQVAPRVVLYTDDMEPITVLELPSSVCRLIEQRGRVLLPVREDPMCVEPAPGSQPYPPDLRIVEVWAERFTRHGRVHYMLFTRNDENALLLKAAFLPGQRRQLKDERVNAFAQGFFQALSRL